MPMDIRKQLQNRLTKYVEDTLRYNDIVRDFCDQEQKWTTERRAELKKLSDINENLKEEKLDAVLAETLKGLKKLEPFLDAVEKLTVTSRHVFSEKIFLLREEKPESMQSVITDARIDAPLLIHFKRNAETFFRPVLDNVNVLVFQLDNYVLNTEQLCRRIRQSSVLSGDLYIHKMNKPLVQLTLNVSENVMNQMLHHLNQLCKIRLDQHTRLAFLFQENAQKFIDVFSEHRSRMWQFLSDLEETAVKLDSMKKGASISNVASSSVGIVGGIMSIVGLVLAPFTAGASLGLSLAGASLGGLGAVNALVTGVTEMAVNSHHEHYAQSYFKSYKDDMIKIVECLKEAANSERPLVRPSGVDAGNVLHCVEEVSECVVDVLGGAAAFVEHKSKNVTTAVTEVTVEGLENAHNTPQVAVKLSKTGQLVEAETLAITRSVRVASGFLNVFFIGLDIFVLTKESISLANGSESEFSHLIRSRAVLWKSELEAWEKIHDSLCIGIKTFDKSKDTLEKPFLP